MIVIFNLAIINNIKIINNILILLIMIKMFNKYRKFKVCKTIKSKQIKKDLIKHTILLDPLVDEHFYWHKLNELSINRSQLEAVFKNTGNHIPSLMALLRGHQLGLIDNNFIYNVIDRPADVRWLIYLVQIKLHKLLGLDEIKLICRDNPGLYEIAVRKRINGFSFDEVCYFVEVSLININNKE